MHQEDEIKNLEKDYQVTLARLDKARKEYGRIAPISMQMPNSKDL